MVGDLSYALGVLRQSLVGLTKVMAGAGGGGGGWKGTEGKRFLVRATGVGEGGVGTRGSTVATEN